MFISYARLCVRNCVAALSLREIWDFILSIIIFTFEISDLLICYWIIEAVINRPSNSSGFSGFWLLANIVAIDFARRKKSIFLVTGYHGWDNVRADYCTYSWQKLIRIFMPKAERLYNKCSKWVKDGQRQYRTKRLWNRHAYYDFILSSSGPAVVSYITSRRNIFPKLETWQRKTQWNEAKHDKKTKTIRKENRPWEV